RQAVVLEDDLELQVLLGPGGVDLVERQLGPLLHALAVDRRVAGQVVHEADLDALHLGPGRQGQSQGEQRDGEYPDDLHGETSLSAEDRSADSRRDSVGRPRPRGRMLARAPGGVKRGGAANPRRPEKREGRGRESRAPDARTRARESYGVVFLAA